MPNVLEYRLTLSGDLVLAERTVEYGTNRSHNTAITEMQDGKVKGPGSTSLRPLNRRSGERGGSKGCRGALIHSSA
jgi:hypothetical protein